jgi:heat shock protein HslJ
MISKKQTTNRIKMSVLLLIVLALAGCSSAPQSESIRGITWQWTQLVETEPDSQSLVPTPENYTLTLLEDGSMRIQADCNQVSGTYTLEGASLTLAMGPSTLAYCGEQSVDYLFVGSLSLVESFSLIDGQLVLEHADGAASMTFDQAK